jgi:hypothetical protein
VTTRCRSQCGVRVRDGLSRLHADVYRGRREQELSRNVLDLRGLVDTGYAAATALINLEEARKP